MEKRDEPVGEVHTVPTPNGEGWANEVRGEVVSRHHTKEHAVEHGRELARRSRVEHVIHNRDGRIAEKNSYGNDPCPPRDGQ
jgi:ketosteroid isomerase-like protein